MEHTLHLASKVFIEEICPTPSRYKKKKPRKAGTKGDKEDDKFEEDDEEWDDEVAWLASLADDAPAVEGEEIDEDMDYDPGDLLDKVLALVNQVRLFSFLNLILS
jgi:hypothetical protein